MFKLFFHTPPNLFCVFRVHTRGVNTAFHAHRLLLRSALAFAGVFAWLILFQYFYSFPFSLERALGATALTYLVAQIVIGVFTPLAMRLIETRGAKHLMVGGSFFVALAFIALAGLLLNSNEPAAGAAAFAVIYGLSRVFYTTPYALIEASSKGSFLRGYLEIVLAVLPVVAGAALSLSAVGAPLILFGGALFAIAATIPALFLSNQKEKFSWSARYAYRQILRSKNSALVGHAFLEGIRAAVLFLVWPLVIFFVLAWSHFLTGLVLSLSFIAIIALRRYAKNFFSFFRIHESLPVQLAIVISGWTLRLASGSVAALVVADVYASLHPGRTGVVTDPATLESGSDRGAFLDEYTALKEMALALGRATLALALFLLSWVASTPIALALALALGGCVAALSIILARRAEVDAF